MLKQILDAHDGALPENVRAVFANTGKEMPETLDFVQECSEQWNVPVVWLEYRAGSPDTFEIVSHNSASRNGEPYKSLIDKRGFLPNPVARFCTQELKIRTMQRYAWSMGWNDWINVVGLRADEPRRVANMRARDKTNRDGWAVALPLDDAGVTVADISKFWSEQLFDLRLPNINGSTPLGNCDLCFLKGAATIAGIIRERPELAKWWIKAEAEARASKPSGARFRSDRPGYARMLELSQLQGDLFPGADNATQPCMCHD